MAGNHRRPCNVPSHPFSFGVPKEVTDVLAIGLESQESDCTRAPRTRDPIIGEATFRPQSVTERATLTSRQTWAKFRLTRQMQDIVGRAFASAQYTCMELLQHDFK